VYDVQLHQLTQNSLLHIACFITLYEAFLGVEPHWILWKYLFCLRPSGYKDEIPELGGAIVIRLKRIYNFGCSMLVLHQLLCVLFTLCGIFMHFPELTY
jgi:hypothetical protein